MGELLRALACGAHSRQPPDDMYCSVGMHLLDMLVYNARLSEFFYCKCVTSQPTISGRLPMKNIMDMQKLELLKSVVRHCMVMMILGPCKLSLQTDSFFKEICANEL